MPISRRKMFQNMTLAGMAASAAASAAPADEPKLAELPNFKYDIESQTHWVGPGGSAKEATVAEFPISQSIAGVSMRLKPGAHLNKPGLEGACRAHVGGPSGCS